MNEQDLRALVRDVIARRAVQQSPSLPLNAHAIQHASHGLFVLSDGSDGDGPCIIEPAVSCNHCGYCKSMGH
jgi:hypothetical protein